MAPEVGLVTGADLSPGAPGGTKAYVLGLARYLLGAGVRVAIVTNGVPTSPPEGARVIPVTSTHSSSARVFQRALGRWDRSGLDGVDILHFQRPDDAWAMGRRLEVPPAVCTLHGNPHRGIRRRRGRATAAAYRYAEGRALPRFRALITVDPSTAAEYRTRYPALSDRIHVIPPAVEADGSSRSREGRSDVRAEAPTFVYAGRLSPEKRVDRIIEAVTDPRAPRGSRLLVAGAGPDESRLRRLAHGSPVEFLGSLPFDWLAAVYGRADALILASEFEGFPTVALEAVARGCPVVALAGCGLDEFLTDGRGVLAGSVDELPSALTSVLSLRRGGGSVLLPDEFRWDYVGPKILRVYAASVPEAFR